MTKPGKMMINIPPIKIDPASQKVIDSMAKYAAIVPPKFFPLGYPYVPVETICPFCQMKFGIRSDETNGECPECGETWVVGQVETSTTDTFIRSVTWDNGEDLTQREQDARQLARDSIHIRSRYDYGIPIKHSKAVLLGQGGT